MISPYILILAWLVVAGLLSFYIPALDSILYKVCFVILALFLLFRFGQGTDWLGYNYIYSFAPSTFDFSDAFYTDAIHSEIGWKLLNNLFKFLGLKFIHLVLFVSIIELICLRIFIKRYSSIKTVSLMIAYPTLYLTYYFSSLRQGLVTALFLAFALRWLYEKKYVTYVLGIVGLSLFHTFALAFLPLVFFVKLKPKTYYVIMLLSMCIGFAGFSGLIQPLYRLYSVEYTDSFSLISLLQRIVISLIIYFLYKDSEDRQSDEDTMLVKVFFYGLALYVCFMSNELIAARLASALLVLDVVLVPKMLSLNRNKTSLFLFVIVAIVLVMTVKNINSYILQSAYLNGVTVINYPYISIFNPYDIYLYSSNRYLPYLSLSNSSGIGLFFQ